MTIDDLPCDPEINGERREDVIYIRVVVPVRNANGNPELVGVTRPDERHEIKHGSHYEYARKQVSDMGYEPGEPCFDELDGPKWLFHAVFDDVTISDL